MKLKTISLVVFLVIFGIYAGFSLIGILQGEYGISIIGKYYIPYGAFIFFPIYLYLAYNALKELKMIK